MISKADPLSADLKRIPGLYRRWELPEILRNQRAYRIENAGAHQDGTPLVAIFADARSDHHGSHDGSSTETPEAAAAPSGTISLRRE
ncbi:hypothetical protein [Rhodosalinus sp. K401]|uniref:hypothetical protein n=1 Tax=Rhodosalinus sp. K401 TaxID=3239195 RepID=UPI0035250327